MTTKARPIAAKRWECKKCGATYVSALKVVGVLCPVCSNRVGTRADVWMEVAE